MWCSRLPTLAGTRTREIVHDCATVLTGRSGRTQQVTSGYSCIHHASSFGSYEDQRRIRQRSTWHEGPRQASALRQLWLCASYSVAQCANPNSSRQRIAECVLIARWPPRIGCAARSRHPLRDAARSHHLARGIDARVVGQGRPRHWTIVLIVSDHQWSRRSRAQ